MRVKSDQIVRAKAGIESTFAGQKGDVLILPTDDSRLRIVLIPGSFIDRSNMLPCVQDVLQRMQAIEVADEKN